MSAVGNLHPLTVGDYLHLVENGRGRYEATELVEGMVYDVSPESLLHVLAVRHLLHGFEAALPGRVVLPGGSIELGGHSLWIPDLVVLRADAALDGTYVGAAAVEVVVEVSVSTIRVDLGVKLSGYARANIAEYWVVVPQPDGFLLQHRHSDGDGYQEERRTELPEGYKSVNVTDLLDRSS